MGQRHSQGGVATEPKPAASSQANGTAKLFEESSRYMPGGTSRLHYYYQPYPIYAESGNGCYLTDVEGVERIDYLNNMTALIHGHANPGINEAVIAQLQRGTAFSEPAEPELRLARLLVERVPSLEKIRFANSGTEAVMLAVKLARAFTGRSRIAKFEGFYHGYYDYVQVSYSSQPDRWGPATAPHSVASSGGLADSVESDVLTLPFNDKESVIRLLEQHGSEIAGLLYDPLCNRAGFPLPQDDFLSFLREITRDYGIVLISDEVISFRVSYAGGAARFGGDPDLTVFGKIIGGGLPIGAVGGRAEIMALLDPTEGPPALASGGTYSGNPLSATAGYAALTQIPPDEYARLEVLGDDLRTRAKTVFAAAGVPGQVSGAGSLILVVPTDAPIVNYRSIPKDPATEARMRGLHRGLMDAGIIVSKEGLGALSTPMGQVEVDRFIVALEHAVQQVADA
ncbi:MAG: aspartate aminotransferase family protein [Chloroflexota bacterium]|nr:aspartate aminotransferase family protein [Chloroflexota bacterium]MDE2931804.1 aspartate aminotransferase family protein [Chloroflexota bacterium]